MSITLNKSYGLIKITTKPWWTTHAVKENNDQVIVARCHGESEKGRHMVDLTEDELNFLWDHPDYLKLDNDWCCLPATKNTRPLCNKTEKAVSKATSQKAYDSLINEGY